MQKIYLDYAATTPLDKRVLKKMMPYFTEQFGNANSVHSFGMQASRAVMQARNTIAQLILANPKQIYFTSSGTEANNWAIKGILSKPQNSGKHIITSSIEHHSVYDTCKALEKKGYKVTYLPVDKSGIVDLKQYKKALTADTVLVSCMYANNEVGTIQPIKKMVQMLKEHNSTALFHTDAVQAASHISLDVEKLGIDMMTVSAHKFYGPKGTAFLYIKNSTGMENLIHGGTQEQSKRGGTTNVAGIVGMAAAYELHLKHIKKHNKHIKSLRDYLVNRVLNEIEHSHLNGSLDSRLPSNANFSLEFIEGEALILDLDLNGIAVSTGSACASELFEPSHVLLAMGLSEEMARSSVRISLGKATTLEQIDTVIDHLKRSVKRLREMSPLYKQIPTQKFTV